MEYLFSFLLLAVLFYLLMHFAPGLFSFFGYRGWLSTEHIDPVCGMKVDADKGYGKMWKGKLFRFCSKQCLDRFDANPQSYMHRPTKIRGDQS